jgi:hypothetical protein
MFPSKMVLIRGNPNARVFCAPQNVAAFASSEDRPKMGEWKIDDRDIKEPACRAGRRVRRAAACFISNPIPLVNALQNAFHTIPRMTHCRLQAVAQDQLHHFDQYCLVD